MKQTFVRQVARRTNGTNKVPKSAKPPRGWGRKSLDLVMRRPTANTKGVVERTAIMASTKAVSVRAMGGCRRKPPLPPLSLCTDESTVCIHNVCASENS